MPNGISCIEKLEHFCELNDMMVGVIRDEYDGCVEDEINEGEDVYDDEWGVIAQVSINSVVDPRDQNDKRCVCEDDIRDG